MRGQLRWVDEVLPSVRGSSMAQRGHLHLSLNVAYPNSGSASIEVWQFSSGHDATSSVLDDVRGGSSRHSEWSTSVDKTVHNTVDSAVDNFGDKLRFNAPPPAPPRRAQAG